MAETTKALIAADIATKLADNASGEISAADSQEVHTDILDSALCAQDAQEHTRTINFNATSLTDAANIAWNLESNQVSVITLTDNRTLDNPTNMVDGATYILRVVQDATGSRTLAYGAAYKWPGGLAPVLSTTANAVDILTFVSDGTNMYGVFQGDFK